MLFVFHHPNGVWAPLFVFRSKNFVKSFAFSFVFTNLSTCATDACVHFYPNEPLLCGVHTLRVLWCLGVFGLPQLSVLIMVLVHLLLLLQIVFKLFFFLIIIHCSAKSRVIMCASLYLLFSISFSLALLLKLFIINVCALYGSNWLPFSHSAFIYQTYLVGSFGFKIIIILFGSVVSAENKMNGVDKTK